MQTRSTALLTSLLVAVAAAACGDDGGSTPPDAAVDVGFNDPTAPLKANDNNVEVGPADLSCLGTPADDPETAVVVTLATTVKDFQNDTLVPNAVVTAFRNVDLGQPFDTQTADGAAMASITIPTGVKRFGFKMTDPSSLDTLLLNQTVRPDMMNQMLDIQTVSKTTATLLPALINKNRTMGTGVIAGAVRDCQGREISNFIATVSSTQGTATPLRGVDAYYFSASGSPLPVRHNQLAAASANGLFMVIEIEPAATAYVQVWGYPTDADLAADNLKLIAELQAPVIAETVITGSYEPLRTGQ